MLCRSIFYGWGDEWLSRAYKSPCSLTIVVYERMIYELALNVGERDGCLHE